MRNGKRGRYTLEFKQEAVRLVESGQSIAEAARSLGVVEQTLVELGQGASRGEVEGGQRQDRGSRRSRWRSAVCERSWRG